MIESIGNISNEDVQWSGTYIGLTPTLSSDAAKRLADLDEQAIPNLLAVLRDPKRFVTAHVMLTLLSGMEYQTFPAWNGLVVDIAQDGTVNIDVDQRVELTRRWEKWFHTKPRPPMLPY